MPLYREQATGFLQEWATPPGAGYTLVAAQPTGTLASRVAWWRGVDLCTEYAPLTQTSAWHPSLQGGSEVPKPPGLAGSGVNVMAWRYSNFEEPGGLPGLTLTSTTAALVATGLIDANRLRLTSTAANGTAYLTPTNVTYNIKLTQNSRWLVSLYCAPVTAGAKSFSVLLKTTTATYELPFATSATAGTWTRVCAGLDLTADTAYGAMLGVKVVANATAVDLDAVMIEEWLGDAVVPSAYHAPITYLDGAQIVDASITGTQIATAAITGDHIGAATITGANIGSAAISGTHIGALTISGANIANLTITASNIADLTITGAKLANATLTGAKIAGSTITDAHILGGTITGASIANATLTGAKIAASTITGANIASSTLTDSHFVGGTITGASIANATISGAKIGSSTITGSNLVGGTITGAHIANATITGANIASATITDTNIANATISSAKIASLDAGKITTGTLNAASITVANLNCASLTVGTITTTQIANAGVTASSGYYSGWVGGSLAPGASANFWTPNQGAVSYGRGNIDFLSVAAIVAVSSGGYAEVIISIDRNGVTVYSQTY